MLIMKEVLSSFGRVKTVMKVERGFWRHEGSDH